MDDPAVDALYALPLDEFVAARNALARERREPELRRLKKPSAPAWAVNQLVRRHPEDLDRLVAAADDLRRAQRRVLSGTGRGSGGPGAVLRDAVRAHRDAVEALVAHLPSVAPAATPSTVERVRSTLAAASTSEDGVDVLRAGRLVEDVEPAGFGDVAGLELLAAGQDEDGAAVDEPETEPRPDPRAAAREEARGALDAARAALTEAEQARRLADRQLRDAEARADAAAQAVREAERAVRRAETALERLSD